MTDEAIKELVAEVLKVDYSVLSDDLAIGDISEWDSLRHMMILSALEKEYQIKFTREELVDVEDLGDLVALVQGKLAQK